MAVLHWFRNFAVNEVHVGSIPIGHLTISGVVDSVGRIPWFSSRSPRVRFPLTSSKKQVAKVVKTFGSLDSADRMWPNAPRSVLCAPTAERSATMNRQAVKTFGFMRSAESFDDFRYAFTTVTNVVCQLWHYACNVSTACPFG